MICPRRRPLPSLPIIACLLTLAASGCVRTHRIADVRSRLDEVVGKIDRALRQTEADVREMRRICEPLLATRPRLRQILKRIDAQVDALRGQRHAVAQLRGRLDRMVHEHPEVREDSPEWAQMQRLQADYSAIGKRVEQIVEQYKSDANELLAAAQAT